MASRRRYLTQAELEEFADIDVTNVTEGDDKISQAEELIDAYVGPQDKFYQGELVGKAQSGSTTGFKLQSEHIDTNQSDYWKDCEVEIVGGSGVGETKRITASDNAGNITTDTFSTALDNTTIYKIYQMAKFPRFKDCTFESQHTSKWYKSIPEMVKRATAAQLEYMINMGDKFFSTDASKKTSESIGDYAYSKEGSSASIENLIAPKAKNFLKGILNRKGVFI